jgi:hypothetical protein
MDEWLEKEKEFAIYLVTSAQQASPELPYAAQFIAATMNTIGSHGDALIEFKSREHRSRSTWPMALLMTLLERNFVSPVPSTMNTYIVNKSLFKVVEHDFLPLAEGDWITASINFAFLSGVMITSFSQDELNTVCLEIDIDPEELGATDAPKSVRVERLIKLAIDKRHLGKMLRHVERERPQRNDWLQLFEV